MKCYACGQRMSLGTPVYTSDDGRQEHLVGQDCYLRVKDGGAQGWQPPKGGPRLYASWEDAAAASAVPGTAALSCEASGCEFKHDARAVQACKARHGSFCVATPTGGGTTSPPTRLDDIMAMVYLFGTHRAEHPEDEAGAAERLAAIKGALDLQAPDLAERYRRVTIEQRMFDAASGKRSMPSPDELRQWAAELKSPTSGLLAGDAPLPVRASELEPKYAEAGPLLELDGLLGALVAAVQAHTRADAADDLAGTEEAKAVQQHVRRMLRGGVVPDGLPASHVASLQFKLIDAAKALQHAAEGAVPGKAAIYKKRAAEVFDVISALAPSGAAPVDGVEHA